MPFLRARRRAVEVLLAFAAGLIPAPASSLDTSRAFTQHILDSWGVKEGLRQHGINDIAQTRDGYLWFATQDGLVRFDGVRFVTFDSRTTRGFGHDFVYSLVEAPDGTLWVGTYHGLTRVQNGAFQTYAKEDGLADAFVRSVTVDQAGALWASGYTGLSHRQADRLDADPRFRDKDVRAVAASRRGGLWVGALGALSYVSGGEMKLLGAREGLPPQIQIVRLHEGPDGTLWIASTQGLGRWAGGALRLFTTADGLSTNTISDVLVDRAGNVWVGTAAGLHRVVEDRVVPMRRAGLGDEDIETLFEDREGSLWIGTRASGLRRLRDGRFTMFGQPEGVPVNDLWVVRETSDGRVWLGTGSGPATVSKEGRVVSMAGREGLGSADVYAVEETRDGALWLGHNGAVTVLRAGQARRYGPAHGVPVATIRAIHEDAAGRLWLGTTGAGVYVRTGERFAPEPAPQGVAPGTGYISTILEGKDGTLWFGTDFGLWKRTGSESRVFTPRDGLPGDYVSTIFEDSEGLLWVGTNPGGLARFEGGRFSVYRAGSGLLDERVHAIVEDRGGRLWFSSDRGIFAVAKKELADYAAGRVKAVTSTVFDSRDGLRVSEGNAGGTPSAWRASDGRLWFATVGGAAVVDPEDQRQYSQPPTAFIEELVVDGRILPAPEGLALAPGTRKLEIRYTAPSLRVPERTRFQFRLEGFDSEWSEPTEQRVAHYTNIPPGPYRFVVRAANDEGLWSADSASVSFRLRPHLYQTAWFKAFLAALGAAAAFGAHRLRVHQLRAGEKELKRRVEEALSHVKLLRGMLPVCASCKKIRDDRGYWSQMETYFAQHTSVDFSHGICPDCIQKLYPEYAAQSAAPSERTR